MAKLETKDCSITVHYTNQLQCVFWSIEWRNVCDLEYNNLARDEYFHPVVGRCSDTTLSGFVRAVFWLNRLNNASDLIWLSASEFPIS